MLDSCTNAQERWGGVHQLIDRWLAEQGRAPGDFDPVERLCYTGRRGMGALEFEPSSTAPSGRGRPSCPRRRVLAYGRAPR